MLLGRRLRRARGCEERGQREKVACAAWPVRHEREDLGEKTLLDARFLRGVGSCQSRGCAVRTCTAWPRPLRETSSTQVTYQLRVEFGQARLTLAIEDQNRVDHDGSFFSSDMGGLCWSDAKMLCETVCRKLLPTTHEAWRSAVRCWSDRGAVGIGTYLSVRSIEVLRGGVVVS